MINHKRLKLTQIALSLSIALATVPAMAQNTTSAIGGRIVAADGKPAAGALVTIVHKESGSVTTVVTDADGHYVQRGLRAGGPYTITISKDGVTETREEIYTQLADTANVDATLGGAAAMQSVTVTGAAGRSEIFSKSNMGSVTSINSTQLQAQASISRNLQDYARADPRVAQTDKGRGEMSVAGQNSRYNTLTIDGVSVTDTFGLAANGSPTYKQPITIEAIQSVQVNVANYDVTQKGYTGGNINAVTKSGTNTVKGSVYYVFRNDRLAGDRYNITNNTYSAPPPSKEITKGGNVGTPLIADKLFMFASWEKVESSRAGPAFGPIGSGLSTVGITQSAIASAQSIAKSQYNTDIGTTATPSGSRLDLKDQLLKFDWNINDNHRAMFRYAKTSQTEPQYGATTSSNIALSSVYYQQATSIETKVGQLLSDWTPNLSTELKISKRDFDSVPALGLKAPLMTLRFSGALPAGTPSGVSSADRSMSFGTDNSRQMNILGTKTTDLYAGANWSHGDHEVKFGSDYAKNEIYNAFLQNVWGNYTFACIDNIAYSFMPTGMKCGSASNADIEKAVLENFQRGRPLSYSLQVANPGLTVNDAVSQFTMKDTGAFVQDTWTVNPRLTITGGVRVDYTGVNGTPLRNTFAAAAAVPGNPATGARATGGFGLDNTVTFDGQKLFQPRIGFNYTLDTARKTQIRGGAGLFQGAALGVWLSNPFSNTGVQTRTIGCGGSFAACPNTDGLLSVDPNNQPTNFAGSTPAMKVDALAPGLRQPSVWKSNIAFETELPWYGLVLGGEYLNVKAKDAIYYQNLNMGVATKTGTDGRPLYYTAAGYNPLCWGATGSSVSNCSAGTVRTKALSNAAFTDVLVATGTKGGGSSVSTLSLSRPLTSGFGWSVSYSYTSAKEVSPLTSSTSSSNYSSRASFDPNENVNANAAYLVKDRINALVNFQKRLWGAYKTTVGVFYEGRSGKPYSWTVNNDLNGDGLAGNDLMFIPSAPGSGQVVFYGDTATSHANEDKFWSIVNSNSILKKSAGGVVGRNTDFSPWTNSFDLRISQELPGFWKGHKSSFTFDIFNFGNLLNKKWGHINEMPFLGSGGNIRTFVDYQGLDASGKYIYRVRDVKAYDVKQSIGESQWSAQATFRYEF